MEPNIEYIRIPYRPNCVSATDVIDLEKKLNDNIELSENLIFKQYNKVVNDLLKLRNLKQKEIKKIKILFNLSIKLRCTFCDLAKKLLHVSPLERNRSI